MAHPIKYEIGTLVGECYYLSEAGKIGARGTRACKFKCKCGKEFVATIYRVTTGRTKSCGCYKIKLRNEKAFSYVDGVSYKNEYNIWVAMKKRCSDLNNKRWYRYGGRGIKVCGRWLNSFENFIEDMGARPSFKHSIDRINNDSNYEPSNCRWATANQQARNKSNTKYLTVGNETKSVVDWCEIYGINKTTFERRIVKGVKVEEALSNPTTTGIKEVLDTTTGIFFDSVYDASRSYNINPTTLGSWLKGIHPNKTNLVYA